MFGLDFLFAAALFALPLAGAPLLLHLLFKRKSPTVQFSTLRFIRASIQQTAARRRLQRWLLLAARVLLLALLIWVIAQPVKRLQASWAGAAKSTIAAIVVDTSYSMQLKDADASLLSRADRAVQDLLRTELKDARVALFTSRDEATGSRGQLVQSNALVSQWAPLTPEAGVHPLADRIAAARTMLANQVADQKWLVIITDLQSREFPRPMENIPELRTVLIDLHPETARSAGITNIAINPPQPIFGVSSEMAIDVSGRNGESRAIVVRLSKPDGSALRELPPAMANFDSGGRAQIRLPIKLPAEPWIVAEARFGEEDAMPWDDARALLVHLPPRQPVRVIDLAGGGQATRFVKLALDPSEGGLAAWPLIVRSGDSVSDDDRVAVVLMSRWPDEAMAKRLESFAHSGRTVILMLQPGIESLWKDLPVAQRAALSQLLPAEPVAISGANPLHLLPTRADQTLLNDIITGADLNSAQVRRMIRFDPTDRLVQTLLQVGSDSTRAFGLLFHRELGAGQIYTLATLPDPRFTNLQTHPIFLPLLVRLSLQSPQQRDSLNAQIGQKITLVSDDPGGGPVTIESPIHETFEVAPTRDAGGQYVFVQTDHPGLYTWRRGAAIAGYTNVQPPSGESELVYRPANSVLPPADNVMVARSLDDMRQNMQHLAEPEPKWSGAMALVLVLMCVEALLGTYSFSRKSPTPSAAS